MIKGFNTGQALTIMAGIVLAGMVNKYLVSKAA